MSRLPSRSGNILIAASVINTVSLYAGTSITKTWLIRLSVRRPLPFAVTLRISSSVCRLPFISISPLAAWISSTAFAAAASLCGASISSNPVILISCLDAAALIRADGPTRIGRMIPASAASATPRSELSSHGCTTIVAAAGIAFAAATRRSYLAPGLASPVSKDATLISDPPDTLNYLRRLRLRFGGETEELCHPIQPLRAFTRHFRTRGQHIADSRKTGAAFVLASRQEFGDSGKTRFRLQQQHEELLANDRLELCNRKA